MSHDGCASYTKHFPEAIHQQCLAHVLRRARELLDGAAGGAVRFPRQVIGLFTEAIHARNEGAFAGLSVDELDARRQAYDERLWTLIRTPRVVPAYATLAAHLERHFEQWFSFVADPALEPTNWRAEQAIHPAVVNRKVWGGNRTEAGAARQSVLMSVLETCRRQARSTLDYVSHALRAFGNRLLASPSLLEGR